MGAPPNVFDDDRRRAAASSSAKVLAAAVASCAGRLTFRTLATRLVIWLAVGLSAPLLVVWADHTWFGGLPRTALNGALLLWGVGLSGALLAVLLITLARRLNPIFVGRQLERICGIRHNSVVNALLVRRSARLTYAGEAATRQAAEDLATHEPLETPGTKRSRVALLALAAAAVVWTLYVLLSPKPIGPSLARFFGIDRPAPTATWLQRLRPRSDQIVHAGEALTFEFAVRGQPAEDVHLQILDPSDAAAAPRRTYVSNERVGAEEDIRRFVVPPFEVWDDVHFRCVAADARLEGTIEVKPQPAIEELEAALVPPAYTGWPAHVAAEPDLKVLRGTRATFRMQANTVIRDPLFVVASGGETRTRMRVDPADPQAATLTLLLVESGVYRIEFSDPWGAPQRDPPTHRLEVREDTPPTVEITTPPLAESGDQAMDAGRFPELLALAQDDVAIAAAALVLERAGRTTRVPLRLEAGPRVSVCVDVFALPHEPGERARAWFEVQDGRVLLDGRSAPQTARSAVLTLTWPVQETPAPVAEKAESSETDGHAEKGAGAVESGDDAGTDQQEPVPGQGTETDAAGTQEAEVADGVEDSASGSEGGSEDDDSAARRKLREFIRRYGEKAREIAGRLRDDAHQAQRESADAPGKPPHPETEGAKPKEGEGQPPEDGSSKPGAQPESAPQGENEPADNSRPGKPGSPGDKPKNQSTPEEPGGPAPEAEPPPDAGAKPDQEGEPARPEEPAGGESPEPPLPDATGAQPRPAPSPDDQEATSDEAAGGQQAGAKPGAPGPEQPEAESEQPSLGESSTEGPRPYNRPSGPAGPSAGNRPLDDDDWAGAASDIAVLIERGNEVTEEMLVETGFSPDEARAFVGALRELQETLAAAGGLARLPHIVVEVRVGSMARESGENIAGQVQRRADPVAARREGLRRIAPPAEQHIDANLRRVLDAYYRTMAAQRDQAERATR